MGSHVIGHFQEAYNSYNALSHHGYINRCEVCFLLGPQVTWHVIFGRLLDELTMSRAVGKTALRVTRQALMSAHIYLTGLPLFSRMLHPAPLHSSIQRFSPQWRRSCRPNAASSRRLRHWHVPHVHATRCNGRSRLALSQQLRIRCP
jgi:hypothetical protein